MINQKTVIIVLGCLNGLMPFTTDMYLPAFPSIAKEFGVEISLITLSLSSYFTGACLGQLTNGPILDRFGRKNPMLIGLIIFMMASFACGFANSAYMLIAMRFFQALGISVCAVGSRAVVRDIFPVEQIAGIFSTLALIMGIAPIIAPSVGSVLLVFFGWRAIFFVLVLIAFSLFLAIYFFLPDVKKADTSYSLHPKAVFKNYWEVMKTPTFLLYTLVTSAASGVLFAYISSSSFVFIQLLGLTEQQFGWAFATTASSLIIGSQVNRMLLKQYTSEAIAFRASIVQLLVGLFLICVAKQFVTLPSVLILLMIVLFCNGMITPNMMALTLRPFTKNIGSATALMGSCIMAVNVIATAVVSHFHNNTALPMAITIVFATAIGLSIQFFLRNRFLSSFLP